MFGWFKKSESPKKQKLHPVLQQLMEPTALAIALTESISEYMKDVKAGRVSSPAYQRKEDSVVGIWRDTRLEALCHLWGYGASDAMLLADHRQQKKLLDAFFNDKPQFEWPHQPSGEPVHDTLQSVFQVYLFLDKAGSAVGDKESDSLTLKLANKTNFSDFEQQSKDLLARRVAGKTFHHSGDPPSIPTTLLEILFQDVTKKTKTIALSAKFGPDYQLCIDTLTEHIKKQLRNQCQSEDSINEQVGQIRSTMRKILAADDPDHLS